MSGFVELPVFEKVTKHPSQRERSHVAGQKKLDFKELKLGNLNVVLTISESSHMCHQHMFIGFYFVDCFISSPIKA